MTRSGPEVVEALESVAAEAVAEAADAAERRESTERAVREIAERLETRFNELAIEFVPDLDRGTISETLATGRSELIEIADRRDRRLRELDARRVRLADELRSRDADWAAADAEATAAKTAFDAKRQEIEAYLAADADYQQMLAGIDTARRRLEADRARLAEVKLDAEEKRPEYDADRLFTYLRDRDYGGPEYRHGGIVARLDRWVARLIDFPALSASYRFLTDVPELMEQEIERRNAELDELVGQSLDAIKMAERRFGLEPLQRAAESSAKEAERRAERRDRTAEQIDDLTEQIEAIRSQEGGFYATAIERYSQTLAQSGDRVLATEASETATLTDDDLVADIRILRGRLTDEERVADEAVAQSERLQKRADDLQFVARRARQSDLGTDRARFPESFSLDDVVGQHSKGVIDRGRMLEILKTTAEIDPTWSERAYNRTSDVVNSPTAQILIGTAARAAVPVLEEALRRRR